MIRLACMETLREPLNIGFKGLLLKDSLDCWMETIQDAQVGCPLRSWLNCAKISVVLLEYWDTTKTFGTDCCCLTIFPRNTPYRLASGNVKDFSINSVSVSRDPAAKPAKLISHNRKLLKKLLRFNARPYRSTLVRGRSSLSAPQQFVENVGAQRSTTSRTIAFGPSQRRLLRGTQFESRSTCGPGSPHFQCSDFRRLSPLSASIYSRQDLFDSGQCQMAPLQRSQALLRGESGSLGIHFSPSLLTRTKSDRTSLEDYSSKGNPQPLLSFNGRSPVSSRIPIYGLGVTKLVS